MGNSTVFLVALSQCGSDEQIFQEMGGGGGVWQWCDAHFC